MNIWSLMGVSVAVVALYSIGMNELCRSQFFYETYRWYICVGLGWTGLIMFIVGRIRNVRRSKRLQREQARHREDTGHEGEAPEKPFFFFNMAYWGVMFLIFAGVIVVIAPSFEPKVVEAAEPVAPAPRPVPREPGFDLSTLKLQGVVYRSKDSSVIINGRTYFEGEKVEDAEVKTIEEIRVILERDGREHILQLERY